MCCSSKRASCMRTLHSSMSHAVCYTSLSSTMPHSSQFSISGQASIISGLHTSGYSMRTLAHDMCIAVMLQMAARTW